MCVFGKIKCFIVIVRLFFVEFRFFDFLGIWSDVFIVCGEGCKCIDLVFEDIGDGGVFLVFWGVFGFENCEGLFFFKFGWVGILMGGGLIFVWCVCEVGDDVGGRGNGIGVGVWYFILVYLGFFFLGKENNWVDDLLVVFFFLDVGYGDDCVEFFFLEKGFEGLMGFFFLWVWFEIWLDFFFLDKIFEDLILVGFFFLSKGLRFWEDFFFLGMGLGFWVDFFFLGKGFEGDLDFVGVGLEM